MALAFGAACAGPMDGQARTSGALPLPGGETVEQARDRFERVLVNDPQDAAARDGMAASSERIALGQRAEGHMDLALATLLRAKQAEPDNKRILLDLGILEDEMELYLDAEATLERLVTMPPVDPNAAYALARVDMSLGKLKEAEEEMQTYLAAFPMDASAHYGLGRIYLLGLQFEKAESELKRSIELQPKQSEAYYQLGLASLDQNKYAESIPIFEKVLERDPQHGGALVGIGTACFKMKDYAKANEWLLKATRAAPEYQPGHYYLGLTLARLGDVDGSRRELNLATELAAKDSKQSASRVRLANPDGKP